MGFALAHPLVLGGVQLHTIVRTFPKTAAGFALHGVASRDVPRRHKNSENVLQRRELGLAEP
jgi:hypothetical protein